MRKPSDNGWSENLTETDKHGVDPKKIRDFLYVDTNCLNSLYSQVFEGVADEIVLSYFTESSSGEEQKGPLGRGSSLEARVAEASRRSESRVLHDHMYSMLEDRLGKTIFEPAADLDAVSASSQLSGGALIRVRGGAHVNDFERGRQFFRNFNTLGEVVAHGHVVSARQEIEQALEELGDRDKAQKRELQTKLKKMTSTKAIARTLGLYQDEQLLKNLDFMSNMFNPEGLEVTVTPTGAGRVTYRGVLERDHLRISPRRLQALFGAASEAPWVMTGLVSHVPDPVERASQLPGDDEGAEPDVDPTAPSMRDPFERMFTLMRVFERMFLESDTSTAIVVAPLAIYREIPLLGGFDELESEDGGP